MPTSIVEMKYKCDSCGHTYSEIKDIHKCKICKSHDVCGCCGGYVPKYSAEEDYGEGRILNITHTSLCKKGVDTDSKICATCLEAILNFISGIDSRMEEWADTMVESLIQKTPKNEAMKSTSNKILWY